MYYCKTKGGTNYYCLFWLFCQFVKFCLVTLLKLADLCDVNKTIKTNFSIGPRT
jgi:hypothetical protein